MSSTALKIFAAVAVLLAIVLATVGYRMSRDYAQKAEVAEQQVKQEKVEQTLAVVAVKPLAAYKPIPRDALALVPVAVKPVDPYSSIDEVVGKQPLVDVDTGAPLTRRYFREGNILARAIPPGYQGVSIAVTDVLAVGGFLRPGDVVDILIFLRGAEGVDKPQSRVLLEKVRVLAYLEQIIDRPEGVEGGNEQQRHSGNRHHQADARRQPGRAAPGAARPERGPGRGPGVERGPGCRAVGGGADAERRLRGGGPGSGRQDKDRRDQAPAGKGHHLRGTGAHQAAARGGGGDDTRRDLPWR